MTVHLINNYYSLEKGASNILKKIMRRPGLYKRMRQIRDVTTFWSVLI